MLLPQVGAATAPEEQEPLLPQTASGLLLPQACCCLRQGVLLPLPVPACASGLCQGLLLPAQSMTDGHCYCRSDRSATA